MRRRRNRRSESNKDERRRDEEKRQMERHSGTKKGGKKEDKFQERDYIVEENTDRGEIGGGRKKKSKKAALVRQQVHKFCLSAGKQDKNTETQTFYLWCNKRLTVDRHDLGTRVPEETLTIACLWLTGRKLFLFYTTQITLYVYYRLFQREMEKPNAFVCNPPVSRDNGVKTVPQNWENETLLKSVSTQTMWRCLHLNEFWW